MRAVVQRVTQASVTTGGQVAGSIGAGLLALVGVHQDDGPQDAQWIAQKLAELRIFPDASGKMNLSVAQVGGSVLVVSQFTLLGKLEKGRRPNFMEAAPPALASSLVQSVVDLLRAYPVPVQTGVFGAMMSVALVNDGPVTIILDSPSRPGAGPALPPARQASAGTAA